MRCTPTWCYAVIYAINPMHQQARSCKPYIGVDLVVELAGTLTVLLLPLMLLHYRALAHQLAVQRKVKKIKGKKFRGKENQKSKDESKRWGKSAVEMAAHAQEQLEAAQALRHRQGAGDFVARAEAANKAAQACKEAIQQLLDSAAAGKAQKQGQPQEAAKAVKEARAELKKQHDLVCNMLVQIRK